MSDAVKPEPKAVTKDAAAGASVIKRVHGAEESPHDRFMKKHVPAWVVSGAIHVVVLVIMIVVGRMGLATAKQSEEIIQAVVDQQVQDEKNPDLTNPDIGLDSEIKQAVEVDREADVNVKAAVTEEPVGLATAESTTPMDVLLQAGKGDTADLGNLGTEGMFKGGDGGANGMSMAAGFKGRSGATRDKMVREGGGNSDSEAAVARGLAWLARQQRANGSWVYDGTSAGDVCAGTAMGLLPFLAAGQTHKPAKGNTYQEKVLKGVDHLISLQNPANGTFRTATNMYSHSIAAVALCELYGMTGDKRILYPAKAAIDHIIKAQGANGSWGYAAGTEGDTSIVGWAIQALKSAEMCKDIPVPKATLEKARKFLDSVSGGSKKATYGYREGPGQPGTGLTAVGLLCRYYMDGWGPVHPGLQEGVEGLIKRNPPAPARFNMYYYYYATQVVHFHEGDAWFKDWNPKMRDMLVKMQVPQDKGPNLAGSWDKDSGMIGSHCGRLGTTCMALLTLEVYYRHLPLYKRGTDGKAELERAK
ncbi:hypothetical protein BH11PLA2_BH11PLA2_28110 [soil metagenome]